MTKILCWILALALVGALVNGELAVDSFSTSPSEVMPGEEVTVILVVENTGEKAEDVLLSLDVAGVPFAPFGSSTERNIEKIRAERSERVSLKLKVLPDAAPGIYKIPVILTHNGSSRTAFISVEIAGTANLKVLLGDLGILKVNQRGNLVLKFVNSGLGEVKFLTVNLPESPLYEIVSPAAVYIGDISSGDFETEEFAIIPRTSDPILTVGLEYQDNANREFSESVLLRVPAYTPEEASSLGLEEPAGRAIPLLAVGAVVLLLFLVYRRVRKRRNHEP